MIIFYLLWLCGGANAELAGTRASCMGEAIEKFRADYPWLGTDGYHKHGPVSYCVAEQFDALGSCQKRNYRLRISS